MPSVPQYNEGYLQTTGIQVCMWCRLVSPTSFVLTQPPQRVRVIKNVITHFSISEPANNLLTQEHLKHGVRFGLQKVSKIHFGSIYWSSLSVADSLSIIEILIKDGKLKFKVSSQWQCVACICLWRRHWASDDVPLIQRLFTEAKHYEYLVPWKKASSSFPLWDNQACGHPSPACLLDTLSRVSTFDAGRHNPLLGSHMCMVSPNAKWSWLWSWQYHSTNFNLNCELLILWDHQWGPSWCISCMSGIGSLCVNHINSRFLCLIRHIGYLHTNIFCERIKPAEQTKFVIRIPARHQTDVSIPKLPTKTTPPPVLPQLVIPEKVFQCVATYLWEMMKAKKNSGFYPDLNSMSWADAKREFWHSSGGPSVV